MLVHIGCVREKSRGTPATIALVRRRALHSSCKRQVTSTPAAPATASVKRAASGSTIAAAPVLKRAICCGRDDISGACCFARRLQLTFLVTMDTLRRSASAMAPIKFGPWRPNGEGMA